MYRHCGMRDAFLPSPAGVYYSSGGTGDENSRLVFTLLCAGKVQAVQVGGEIVFDSSEGKWGTLSYTLVGPNFNLFLYERLDSDGNLGSLCSYGCRPGEIHSPFRLLLAVNPSEGGPAPSTESFIQDL